MDLLERALALAACPLFATLAPAAVIRLAERATVVTLAPDDRRATEDTVWVVATGALAILSRASRESGTALASIGAFQRRGSVARPGHVVGLIRVVAPATPVVEAVAETHSTLLALGIDDMRDVLEEDPTTLAAIADSLARLLLAEAPAP